MLYTASCVNVSGGAFPSRSILSVGALLQFSILFSFCFVPSMSVCCHCKDSIAGCAGGNACPLVTDLAANIALFEGGRLGSVPSVRNLLPPELSSFFTRSVCEALVAIATAPISGGESNGSRRSPHAKLGSLIRI